MKTHTYQCGVSECDHEASIMRQLLYTRGCCAIGRGRYTYKIKWRKEELGPDDEDRCLCLHGVKILTLYNGFLKQKTKRAFSVGAQLENLVDQIV